MIKKRNSIATAGIALGVFALFGVVLLSSVQWLTKEAIAENSREQRLKHLHEIVDQQAYDNNLLESAVEQRISMPGLADVIKVFTATHGQEQIATIYEVTSTEGYSGGITLLVGLNQADNRIRGIRVISHKETPGLGDKIETSKADWIFQFSGKSLMQPTIDQWKLVKEGGAFDQFTGATITPRAVVNAIRETLKYHEGGK